MARPGGGRTGFKQPGAFLTFAKSAQNEGETSRRRLQGCEQQHGEVCLSPAHTPDPPSRPLAHEGRPKTLQADQHPAPGSLPVHPGSQPSATVGASAPGGLREDLAHGRGHTLGSWWPYGLTTQRQATESQLVPDDHQVYTPTETTLLSSQLHWGRLLCHRLTQASAHWASFPFLSF